MNDWRRFCGWQIFAPENADEGWETFDGEQFDSLEKAQDYCAVRAQEVVNKHWADRAKATESERELYKRLHKKYGRKK